MASARMEVVRSRFALILSFVILGCQPWPAPPETPPESPAPPPPNVNISTPHADGGTSANGHAIETTR